MKRCPGCDLRVETYAPGESYTVLKPYGPAWHVKCAEEELREREPAARIARSCKHPNAQIVETTSGWPADTSILRYRCFECGATWTEELTVAEQEREEAAARLAQHRTAHREPGTAERIELAPGEFKL